MGHRFLLGLTSLIAALALAVPSVRADPPIWRVRDADTELVLYGSVHTLPDGVDWRSPEFDAVVDAADLIVFDHVTPGSREEARELMRTAFTRYGPLFESMLSDRPLGEVVSADTFARVRALAERHGSIFDVLESSQPWAVAMSLHKDVEEAGYRSGIGLDREFEWSIAADRRKASLDTMDTSMAPLVMASALGDHGGEPLLAEALDWLESPRTPVRDRDLAWATGDLQPFARDVTGFQRTAPGLYEIAFVLRARAWTSVLLGMMETETRVVVFVPADALVGEHGLPNLLRQAGYTVEGP